MHPDQLVPTADRHVPSANHLVLTATHTGTALLDGLKDPANDVLWAAYVAQYRPILHRVLSQRGISDSDADDIVQSAWIEFAQSYRSGNYMRERGRLRSWLFGILKNQMRNWGRRKQARDAVEQNTGLQEALALQFDESEVEAQWEREWRDAVLRQTLDQARAEVPTEQWEAFRLFVLEGRNAQEVARELETTATRVYSAKRRILDRVRALRPMMQDLL